jgi:hypothetical protein
MTNLLLVTAYHSQSYLAMACVAATLTELIFIYNVAAVSAVCCCG